MTEALQPLLAWIDAHPGGALWLLFVIALLDSLLIVGAFVPAALPLFAIGALIALGSLDLSTSLLVAAAGAVVGDGFSFWLGARYRERLFASRFFVRHPEILVRAQRFFERYGIFSIVLARFLGPVRAVTPALAAASGMRPWWFVLADLPAAALWAAAFIMPGVVFGASLGLAAEVAGRLATLLLLVVIGLGLLIWLTGLVSGAIGRYGGRWIEGLLDWSRRHRRLGRFGVALLDEDLPEAPALGVLALVLLLSAGAALYLLAGSGLHQYPSVPDASLSQWLQELHTPWGVAMARRLIVLGSAVVYVPLALVTLAVLLLWRKPRATGHWLAALIFGAAIVVGLYAVPLLAPPARYFDQALLAVAHGRDFVLATITWSFLPVLLATSRPAPQRRLLYSLAAIVLGLVLFAQLYLGMQWPSVAALLLGLGLAWSTLLGIGYRRHRPEVLPRRPLLALLALTVVLTVGWRWAQLPETTQVHPSPARALSFAQWQQDTFRALPTQRQDVAGRPRQGLPLQWSGSLREIEAALLGAGWQPTARLAAPEVLRWLASEIPIAELPVLPQVHAGEHPALSLRWPIDDTHQYLLRLWPTPYRLDGEHRLWVGSVALQETRSVYRLLRYPIVINAQPPLAPLLAPLPVYRRVVDGVWLLWS